MPDRPGHPTVYRVLEEAAALHDAKNAGYRSAADPLANFKQAPPVARGKITPLQYAYTLMSKQDDAVIELVWARARVHKEAGHGDPEGDPEIYIRRGGDAMLRERLMDGIVYRALMIALMDETT